MIIRYFIYIQNLQYKFWEGCYPNPKSISLSKLEVGLVSHQRLGKPVKQNAKIKWGNQIPKTGFMKFEISVHKESQDT